MKCRFSRLLRRLPLVPTVRACALLAALLAPESPGVPRAAADERLFGYSQSAEVLPQGKWEFEQWLTHRRGKAGESFSAWDLREELEYGLLDNLKVAGYLNFRQTDVSSTAGDSSQFQFKGISGELKYRLLNPETQPIGIALYFEPTYIGNQVELEEKLILQKNFGDKWVGVFNTTLEQEWKRKSGATAKETTIEFTAGLAYRLNPHWSVGLEGRQRTIFDALGFHQQVGSAWFVGPNVHYGSPKWWATFTVLPQVSGTPATNGLDLGEHEKIEFRLLIGWNF
jgi:hypothetical protein